LCPYFIISVLFLIILKINYFINNLLLIIFLKIYFEIFFILNYYLNIFLHILNFSITILKIIYLLFILNFLKIKKYEYRDATTPVCSLVYIKSVERML